MTTDRMELVAALREARDALRLCDPDNERVGIQAPEDAEIYEMCERIGYGAVIDAAARLWRRRSGICAHTHGPAVGTVQRTLDIIERALNAR